MLFGLSDEQAMWRVQTQDDHRAFARLMDRWEGPICQLCYRMTGDPHRAEDLKQEAFRRLFEKRKDYHPSGRFSTYLWRIALNLCYDEIRRVNRRRESPLESSDADAPSPLEREASPELPPDAGAVGREEAELVRQAVMQLPEIYRTVIVLRHYEALKLREIAEVLEVPEGTVNSRMAKALAELTRLLEPSVGPERSAGGSSPAKGALKAERFDARRSNGAAPTEQARSPERNALSL